MELKLPDEQMERLKRVRESPDYEMDRISYLSMGVTYGVIRERNRLLAEMLKARSESKSTENHSTGEKN